jgi:hypothetical protein
MSAARKWRPANHWGGAGKRIQLTCASPCQRGSWSRPYTRWEFLRQREVRSIVTVQMWYKTPIKPVFQKCALAQDLLAPPLPRRGLPCILPCRFLIVLTIFVNIDYFIDDCNGVRLWVPVQTTGIKPQSSDLNGILLRSMRCLFKPGRPHRERSNVPLHSVFFGPL